MTKEDKSIPDLTTIDWGERKLTTRQKLFVFYYCEFGAKTYHNGYHSMIKAGFSKKNAMKQSFSYRKRFADIIERTDQENAGMAIKDAVNAIMGRAINIATVPATSLYKGDDEGDLTIVPPDKLAKEQQDIVRKVDFKGAQMKPVYETCDPLQAMTLVDKWWEKFTSKGNNSDFNVALTLEGIKRKLELKLSTIDENEDLKKSSGAIEEAGEKDTEL